MKISEIDRTKLAPMMRHYVELKDKYLSVPYRTGNTNVLYIAVDSLCWIYALAAKKQTVR